ncbi:ribosomal protein L6 [Venturia nashicola]|uniref:Ribosomal protein L6 n=1 Tax=Venturia nashicola TaxID=86259 RepID=A0A4Z1PDL0_9PEZI|nr:ribosomal protein L6 [Venturia nashicola]
MKYIHSKEELAVPEGVKVHIKSRIVTVTGPRGTLKKDLGHLAVSFSLPSKNVINIELHHGTRKNVATLRTGTYRHGIALDGSRRKRWDGNDASIDPSSPGLGRLLIHAEFDEIVSSFRTLINNLFIGVTRGYKYKMRYVYAHFPINVNLEKNKDTGLFEVEIRNFIGEKISRKVVMRPGVDVEPAKNVKDELHLTGISLEDVSQSAADIQQSCRVKNKDIRKFLGM